MATITFDSLKLSDKLKTAGFTSEQAEAVVRVIAEAQDDLVTKKDLDIALAPLKADVNLLKWMMGFVLAGIVAILLKLVVI
jgi:hypothetical protein